MSRRPAARSAPAQAEREALLVLGMHRSGTSALAGVMVHLGAQAPATLMPPNENNPQGYWESMKLYDFHDRLLRAVGSRWTDWRRFDAEAWMESPAGMQFGAELARLLAEEFGAAPLFLVKDPRICRLVPVWLRQLGLLGAAPKVILALRNPLEVARSLSTREGYTLERSFLMWLRHVLDAEFDTRGIERCVVRYEEVLSDWRGVADRVALDLHLTLPHRTTAVESAIDAFLMPQLRHYSSSEQMAELPSPALDWAKRAYRALNALSEKAGQKDALRELDRVRLEFDRQSALFAPAILDQENEAEVLALELQTLRDQAAQSDAFRAKLGEAERAQQALAGELAASRAATAQLNQRVEALASRLEEAERARMAAAAEFEQARSAAAAELEQTRSAATAELEQTRRAAAAELERRSLENRELAHHLAQARESIAWLESRVGELQTDVTSMRKMLARADAAHEAAERLAALQREETTQRELQLHILAGERAKAEAAHRRAGMLEPGRARRKFQRVVRLIAESGLFQREWYLAQNPALRESGIDPLEHYLESGAWSGRDPNPWFDSAWYLSRYPDVLAAGVNPLLHYLNDGAREGRDPGPRFSTAGYLARAPEAARSKLNPLAHYLLGEGASPSGSETPVGAP